MSLDRYDELERLLLRGEYMTTSEMKEFAKLWRRRQKVWRVVNVTIVGVIRAPISVPTTGVGPPIEVLASEEAIGGEATCSFLDR